METTIANRLKLFRQSTGLTQTEFGDACGISQRTYANLESGRTQKVAGDYLSRIEAAFKEVSPNWLRNGVGDMLRPLAPKSEPAAHTQEKENPAETGPTSGTETVAAAENILLRQHNEHLTAENARLWDLLGKSTDSSDAADDRPAPTPPTGPLPQLLIQSRRRRQRPIGFVQAGRR